MLGPKLLRNLEIYSRYYMEWGVSECCSVNKCDEPGLITFQIKMFIFIFKAFFLFCFREFLFQRLVMLLLHWLLQIVTIIVELIPSSWFLKCLVNLCMPCDSGFLCVDFLG